MKLKRWLLIPLMAVLAGCGSDDDGTIDGEDPSNPGHTNGGGTGMGGTGAFPPTSGGTNPGATGGDLCEEQMISNQRVPPDMLIVLDKSASMGPLGNAQGIDRWSGSVEALEAITAELQADIKFGLMTYPAAGASPIPGLPLPASCGVGMLDVPIGPDNGGAIADALQTMMPSGGTPTAGTLQEAKEAIETTVSPDGVVGAKFVLLVTDGAPNCRNGQLSAINDPQSVTDSVNAIKEMAGMDIKTYVIGFQTAQDGTLSAALDQMAVAGATGDTKHRPVENRDTLIAAFRDIAGKAVSCTFVLEKPTTKPEFIQVTIDGKQINLNDPDGWVLSPDGKQITLKGAACQGIQGAGQHTVNVRVKCEPVAPL
jgi:hypothetical protein